MLMRARPARLAQRLADSGTESGPSRLSCRAAHRFLGRQDGTGQKFFLSPEIMWSLDLNVLNPSFSLGVKQAQRLQILGVQHKKRTKCILFEG